VIGDGPARELISPVATSMQRGPAIGLVNEVLPKPR
jgi:hypothetical protein